MEITIVIVLLVVGIIFFLIELFLIPGISIAGIAGTIFMGGAVYYAYTRISGVAGHITLFASIVLLAIAIIVFIRSKALDKMSLQTNILGKNEPMENMTIQIGDKGIASSRLAPMGKVKINGNIIEAKTNDDFIDQGTEIKVVQIYKTNILVERITEK
ncbi:MAG: NfeD family protein [Paludibacter sp.]|nr:NfeD family protein [Paludibacter sp.]